MLVFQGYPEILYRILQIKSLNIVIGVLKLRAKPKKNTKPKFKF